VNHRNITKKISEHHNWKARHQGSTKKSPGWALRTYLGKYYRKSTKRLNLIFVWPCIIN